MQHLQTNEWLWRDVAARHRASDCVPAFVFNFVGCTRIQMQNDFVYYGKGRYKLVYVEDRCFVYHIVGRFDFTIARFAVSTIEI